MTLPEELSTPCPPRSALSPGAHRSVHHVHSRDFALVRRYALPFSSTSSNSESHAISSTTLSTMAFYSYDPFIKRRLREHLVATEPTIPPVQWLQTTRQSFYSPLPIKRQLQYWIISTASIALSSIASSHNETNQHVIFAFLIGLAIGHLISRPKHKPSNYSLTGALVFLLSASVSRNVATWALRYSSIRYPTTLTLLSVGVGYMMISELDWLFGTLYCLQNLHDEFGCYGQLQRWDFRDHFYCYFHALRNACAAVLLPFLYIYLFWGLGWVLYKQPWRPEYGSVDFAQTATMFFADEVFIFATFPPRSRMLDWVIRRFRVVERVFGRFFGEGNGVPREERQDWEI